MDGVGDQQTSATAAPRLTRRLSGTRPGMGNLDGPLVRSQTFDLNNEADEGNWSQPASRQKPRAASSAALQVLANSVPTIVLAVVVSLATTTLYIGTGLPQMVARQMGQSGGNLHQGATLDQGSMDRTRGRSLVQSGACPGFLGTFSDDPVRDVDWPGNDIGDAVENVNVDMCARNCELNCECRAFMMDVVPPAFGRCWLKSGKTTASAAPGRLLWTRQNDGPCPQLLGTFDAPPLANVDWPGNDLGSVQGITIDQCARSCELNCQCVAFMMDSQPPTPGTCWLKSGMTTTNAVPGRLLWTRQTAGLTTTGGTPGGTPGGGNLVWSDEFDGASLNLDLWNYEVLCSPYNGEKQCYTASPDNLRVEGGYLVITAHKTGGLEPGYLYTSARINTAGKAGWTYGRMEARAKVSAGTGVWPAFWMLPTDKRFGEWPRSGEIDILEVRGRLPDVCIGTIHYGPDAAHDNYKGGDITKSNPNFAEDFHVFTVDWAPNSLRFSVDGQEYFSVDPTTAGAPSPGPFDEKFHFIFNLAMGGNFDTYQLDESIQTAEFQIDWVRVYQ